MDFLVHMVLLLQHKVIWWKLQGMDWQYTRHECSHFCWNSEQNFISIISCRSVFDCCWDHSLLGGSCCKGILSYGCSCFTTSGLFAQPLLLHWSVCKGQGLNYHSKVFPRSLSFVVVYMLMDPSSVPTLTRWSSCASCLSWSSWESKRSGQLFPSVLRWQRHWQVRKDPA